MPLGHSNNANKNTYLDVLRGWAILGVITCHVAIFITKADVYSNKSLNQNFIYVLGLGRYGVELFFFISGYLLSSIYKNSDIKPKLDTVTFFTKRLLRIFPLWAIFGIVGFLEWRYLDFGPWVENSVKGFNPTSIVVMSLTFTLFASKHFWNLVPGGWSIQTEMFQYLLFPLLRKRRNRTRILSGMILVYFVCQFSVTRFKSIPIVDTLLGSIIRLNLIPSLFFFLAGIVIAEIDIEKVNLRLISENLIKEKCLVFVFLTSISLGFFANQLQRNVTEGFFMLCMFSILAHLTLQRNIIKKTFMALGRYSYFMYFFHFQVILFLGRHFSARSRLPFYGNIYVETVFFIIGIVVICIPFAFLSMRYIEKPILSLSKYLK